MRITGARRLTQASPVRPDSSGAPAYVNPVVPEETARFLREAQFAPAMAEAAHKQK